MCRFLDFLDKIIIAVLISVLDKGTMQSEKF